MAYLYVADHCMGTEIKFVIVNGEYLTKRKRLFGGVQNGSIALQLLNSGTMRITFCDIKNVAIALGKELLDLHGLWVDPSVSGLSDYLNSNKLCAFEFTKDELINGLVVIKYQVQVAGFSVYAGLMCYDMRTQEGCTYLFDSTDDVEKWAKAIGLKEVEYLDADGQITERAPL